MDYTLRFDVAIKDHYLHVPLDYNNPHGSEITIFAREFVDPNKKDQDLPYLLFLQGGPGFKGDRPALVYGWLKEALKEFRVIILDQRGTGLSVPLNRQTLETIGEPESQAAFLTYFRADSIVKDAEEFRKYFNQEKWTTLGQSYGGFITFTYLSLFPESLQRCLVAGGTPPIYHDCLTVYHRALYSTALANKKYFEMYPRDQQILNEIRDHLAEHEEFLPNGDPLTTERIQLIGNLLGTTYRVHNLHYLLQETFVQAKGGRRLSDTFLSNIAELICFAPHPLYILMHETIYAQGKASLTNAKQAIWGLKHYGFQGEMRKDSKDLSADFTPTAENVQLVGEIYQPWLYRQDSALKPLKDTFYQLENLSRNYEWSPLYNRKKLANNQVPLACIVYEHDVFVDKELSLATLEKVHSAKVWVSDEYQHDGLRVDGEKIFKRLLEMTQK
ncbi:MAG: alpha/beta fold hydrolase [Micrococcaceae bacterium]